MTLQLAAQRRAGGVCTIAKVLAAAGPKDRKTIEQWIANDTISAVRIAESIDGKFAGLRVGYYSVNRHRKGGCTCGR